MSGRGNGATGSGRGSFSDCVYDVQGTEEFVQPEISGYGVANEHIDAQNKQFTNTLSSGKEVEFTILLDKTKNYLQEDNPAKVVSIRVIKLFSKVDYDAYEKVYKDANIDGSYGKLMGVEVFKSNTLDVPLGKEGDYFTDGRIIYLPSKDMVIDLVFNGLYSQPDIDEFMNLYSNTVCSQ